MSKDDHRSRIIDQLADRIFACNMPHPLRVAVDGIDAAGKTSLADELAISIEMLGRPVIRASIDGFHNSRSVRYSRGSDSAEGYYLDSFNIDALKSVFLIPLGPRGNRFFRRAVFDHIEDQQVQLPLEEAPLDAVLLCDGIFLLRPGLFDYWDFSIYVQVDFKVAVTRAVARDLPQDAIPKVVQSFKNRYSNRYVPGQQIYLRDAMPVENATLIMDNNDLTAPRLMEKT